jgi:type IX secretion system PorP/SprF family membrane protein
MLKRRLQTLWVIGFVTVFNVSAQRYFVTNLYPYDPFLANPAAAALKSDCYAINGYYQKQWFGTDLAPTTQMVAFQKAFQNNMGIGSYIYNDRNGNYKEIGAQQTFAYAVTLSKTKRRLTNLQFGLSLLMSQRSLDESGYLDSSSPDPLLGVNNSGFGLNANSGVMLTVNAWQLGLSFTNMLPMNNSMYSEEEPQTPMDINVMLGTSFKVADRNLYLEPLIYYRRNNYVDSRTDVNLKFLMPSVDPSFAWWGNAAYRRSMDHKMGENLGVATTLGIIKNGFKVGLEYQFGLTMAQYDYGSAYQLIVGYRICRDRRNDPIPCSKKTDKLKVGI